MGSYPNYGISPWQLQMIQSGAWQQPTYPTASSIPQQTSTQTTYPSGMNESQVNSLRQMMFAPYGGASQTPVDIRNQANMNFGNYAQYAPNLDYTQMSQQMSNPTQWNQYSLQQYAQSDPSQYQQYRWDYEAQQPQAPVSGGQVPGTTNPTPPPATPPAQPPATQPPAQPPQSATPYGQPPSEQTTGFNPPPPGAGSGGGIDNPNNDNDWWTWGTDDANSLGGYFGTDPFAYWQQQPWYYNAIGAGVGALAGLGGGGGDVNYTATPNMTTAQNQGLQALTGLFGSGGYVPENVQGMLDLMSGFKLLDAQGNPVEGYTGNQQIDTMSRALTGQGSQLAPGLAYGAQAAGSMTNDFVNALAAAGGMGSLTGQPLQTAQMLNLLNTGMPGQGALGNTLDPTLSQGQGLMSAAGASALTGNTYQNELQQIAQALMDPGAALQWFYNPINAQAGANTQSGTANQSLADQMQWMWNNAPQIANPQANPTAMNGISRLLNASGNQGYEQIGNYAGQADPNLRAGLDWMLERQAQPGAAIGNYQGQADQNVRSGLDWMLAQQAQPGAALSGYQGQADQGIRSGLDWMLSQQAQPGAAIGNYSGQADQNLRSGLDWMLQQQSTPQAQLGTYQGGADQNWRQGFDWLASQQADPSRAIQAQQGEADQVWRQGMDWFTSLQANADRELGPNQDIASYVQQTLNNPLSNDYVDAFKRQVYDPQREGMLGNLAARGVLDSSARLQDEADLFQQEFMDSLMLQSTQNQQAAAGLGIQQGGLSQQAREAENQRVNELLGLGASVDAQRFQESLQNAQMRQGAQTDEAARMQQLLGLGAQVDTSRFQESLANAGLLQEGGIAEANRMQQLLGLGAQMDTSRFQENLSNAQLGLSADATEAERMQALLGLGAQIDTSRFGESLSNAQLGLDTGTAEAQRMQQLLGLGSQIDASRFGESLANAQLGQQRDVSEAERMQQLLGLGASMDDARFQQTLANAGLGQQGAMANQQAGLTSSQMGNDLLSLASQLGVDYGSLLTQLQQSAQTGNQDTRMQAMNLMSGLGSQYAQNLTNADLQNQQTWAGLAPLALQSQAQATDTLATAGQLQQGQTGLMGQLGQSMYGAGLGGFNAMGDQNAQLQQLAQSIFSQPQQYAQDYLGQQRQTDIAAMSPYLQQQQNYLGYEQNRVDNQMQLLNAMMNYGLSSRDLDIKKYGIDEGLPGWGSQIVNAMSSLPSLWNVIRSIPGFGGNVPIGGG